MKMQKWTSSLNMLQKKNIPFVVIIGSNEMEQQTCVVKDLTSGKQEIIPVQNISQHFKK